MLWFKFLDYFGRYVILNYDLEGLIQARLDPHNYFTWDKEKKFSVSYFHKVKGHGAISTAN